MMTFAEYHKEKMKDPAFKREYDALEGWFQEELAAQDLSSSCDEQAGTAATEKRIPPPHVSFA